MKQTIFLIIFFFLSCLFIVVSYSLDAKINLLNNFHFLTLDKTVVAGTEYNNESYTCVNYSNDMTTYLRAKNITAISLAVDNDLSDGITHVIIAVLIEPQTGDFIPITEYKYIQLYDREGNVTWKNYVELK